MEKIASEFVARVTIEEWPQLLEARGIDISGLKFSRCTCRKDGMFNIRYCGRNAVAVLYYLNRSPITLGAVQCCARCLEPAHREMVRVTGSRRKEVFR